MKIFRSLAMALATFTVASVALGQSFGTPSPDVGAGQKRGAVCFACHGANGIAKVPGTPHLAGQDRAYLEKALQAYRAGQVRQDPTMTAMAKPLSDADIVNLAAFFSLLPR
ncbi:MAG: cytochrome c [Candidatus Contendobacter sp.]|nr:cytochrome c [Candidatus Contendobacter sp.]